MPTVAEIDELAPLEAAYELKPGVRYILHVKPYAAPASALENLMAWLKKHKIEAVVVRAYDPRLQIFDLGRKSKTRTAGA